VLKGNKEGAHVQRDSNPNVTFNINRALTNRIPLVNEPDGESDEDNVDSEQEDEVLDLSTDTEETLVNDEVVRGEDMGELVSRRRRETENPEMSQPLLCAHCNRRARHDPLGMLIDDPAFSVNSRETDGQRMIDIEAYVRYRTYVQRFNSNQLTCQCENSIRWLSTQGGNRRLPIRFRCVVIYANHTHDTQVEDPQGGE
jgi:hypothetical protein